MPDDHPVASPLFVAPSRAEVGWLVVRRVEPGDEGSLYEAISASGEHLRPWMPWADGYTPATAQDFVDRNAADPAPGAVAVAVAVAVADAVYVACGRDATLLGVAGLHARLGSARLEIGYWVDVRHTRRGVATLAAAALSEAALAVDGVDAVEIHHDEANAPSGAVPARLGYDRIATVHCVPVAPGEIGIEWQWRMTRTTWPSSPGARLLAAARNARS